MKIETDILELLPSDLFAAFRLPGAQAHTLIKEDLVKKSIGKHKEPKQGFLIAPYDKNGPWPRILIQPDYMGSGQRFSFRSNHVGPVNTVTQQVYTRQVEDAVRAIRNGAMDKVVLSHVNQVEIGPQNLFQLFTLLKEAYPDAFVYIFNIPDKGCWIGASPEILLRKTENTIETVALAGTKQADEAGHNILEWGEKEIEEQAIIQRFIETILMSNGLPFKKSKRETVRAGNVSHLKSNYSLENLRIDVDRLAGLLHPGPAICGFPQDAAFEYIKQTEVHDRKYYCGYLGPVNLDDTSLFINLRCMEVFANYGGLYVGGGITEDSEPKSEWEETEMKARTLSSVIEKTYLWPHDF